LNSQDVLGTMQAYFMWRQLLRHYKGKCSLHF
jgi:hypothetical protein